MRIFKMVKSLFSSEIIVSHSVKRSQNTLTMKTRNTTPVLHINDDRARSLAADLMKIEEVIALPTDTVYGLACSANSPSAIKKLYEIKGRDEMKPVAICVSDFDELRKWGHAEHLSEEFLHQILPGAVTLVLERTPSLDNPYLNPHTTKIGIRIPDCEFIQSVCAHSGIPIALTSANPSSIPSSLSVKEFESLYPKLGAVFDGGLLGEGMQETRAGSTVVDLSSKGQYVIIREGFLFGRLAETTCHRLGGHTMQIALAVTSPRETGPKELLSNVCPV